MDISRRSLLKNAGSSSVLAAALVTGLLKPTRVLAADWNKAAFDAKETAAAMKAMGATAVVDSKDILLKVPDIAENGASVQVDVVSNIPNTASLSIFVDKNPTPLNTIYEFSNGALPDVFMRIKMGGTSEVRVVARTADGKFFVAHKEVKVTAGGCDH